MKRALIALVTALFLALSLPVPVLADDGDRECRAYTVYATVLEDATLDVVELRRISCEGTFHGFHRDIPHNSSELGEGHVNVISVGEVVDGRFASYDNSADVDGEVPSTYDVAELDTGKGPFTRVDLHFDKTDESATFYVHYELTGVVARWSDTAELYWKFAVGGWDTGSSNVDCHIFLPAPEGVIVTSGENVRGWLHHAALTGEVQVGEGTARPVDRSNFEVGDAGVVSYEVPEVRWGLFAEARVLFPAEWLPTAPERARARLEAVLAQEADWENAADATRESDVLVSTVKICTTNVLSFAGLVGGIVILLRYRIRTRASFDDKYFRDVPSDDHPAVLAELLDGSAGSPEALTATLMRLADDHVVTLQKTIVTTKDRFGRETAEDDYLLQLDERRAAALEDPIDRGAIAFLFGYVAERARTIPRAHGHEEGLLFSDIHGVATWDEEIYLRHLKEWSNAVDDEYHRLGYAANEGARRLLRILGAVAIGLAVLSMGVEVFLFCCVKYRSEMLVQMILSAVELGVVGGILIRMASRIRGLSADAAETEAKLKALRRWLKDFTRLGEAVPSDVVLWNRLLMMAVMMGVADEVIKQLRVAVPALFDDDFCTSYLWCMDTRGMSSPASAFSKCLSSASSAASPPRSGDDGSY